MSFFLRLPRESLSALNLLCVIACSLVFVSVIPAVSEALYLSSHMRLLIHTDLLQTGVSLTWKANIISWHQSNRLVSWIFWCLVKKKITAVTRNRTSFLLAGCQHCSFICNFQLLHQGEIAFKEAAISFLSLQSYYWQFLKTNKDFSVVA